MQSEGFTLIELMIVVAIIAILAAIALPAYQDYTVRSKISEAVIAASSAKAAVSEAFQSAGTAGVAGTADSWAVAVTSSKYVQGVDIDLDGTVTVRVLADGKNGIPSSLDGKTLNFVPSNRLANLTAASAGVIDWSCASLGFKVATDRGLPYKIGSLPAKYAPAECR
jgi:type IV pilus assembly protein PilA